MTEPRKREPLSEPVIEHDWPGFAWWREFWGDDKPKRKAEK